MPAAAAAPAAASLAPIVSENPPRFLFPSLEPRRRRWEGKGRGTEGMSAPARPQPQSAVFPFCAYFERSPHALSLSRWTNA